MRISQKYQNKASTTSQITLAQQPYHTRQIYETQSIPSPCHHQSRTISWPHRFAHLRLNHMPAPNARVSFVASSFNPALAPIRHNHTSPRSQPLVMAAAKRAACWTTRRYGEIDHLKLDHLTIPPPQPNYVRIRVRAIGLNFADVFACLGLYPLAGPPPLTPGFEVCGVIEAVGDHVTAFTPAQRVFALTRFGGYTTYINIHQHYLQPLPDQWSFAEGAAFPAQAFTAWYALCVLGGLPSTGAPPLQVTSPRKVVLVHSAAGGVGLQLVEMVRRIGGELVCTVGSTAKVDTLKKRGVPRERVIVRGVDDTPGFEDVVRNRALAGAGVDVIVDSVMGDYFQPGYSLLNPGGRYIVMGSASLMPPRGITLLRGGIFNLLKLGWKYLMRPKFDVVGAINDNKTISAFNVGGLFEKVDLMKQGFRQLADMQLPKPTVGKTFRFDEAPQALTFFQSGKSVGKLVLLVDDNDEH